MVKPHDGDRNRKSSSANSNVPLSNRRGILKGIGIGAIGLSTVGTVAADDEMRPAKEAGVLDEYNDLIREGKIEKAHELLDKNEVRYVSETQKIADQNKSDINKDSYSYADSTATCSLVEKSGDTWLATGIADLEGFEFTARDNLIVDDVCSLSWASSDWSAPTPSRSGVFLDAPSSQWDINYESYNPDHGPSATLAFVGGGNVPTESPLVQMQTDIEWIGDNPNIPVKFTYKHNGAFAPPAWINAISVSGGSLSVNLSSGASMIWDNPLEALADPSD